MATTPQQTPVYNSMVHHTALHGPVKFGVLDLEMIHHMFYEAAFWRTQAMNSHVTSADAFDRDWNTTVLFGIVSGIGGPGAVDLLNSWGRTESVENGPPSRLAHLTMVFGRQMCDRYWEVMHTQGVAAAQAYAESMEVARNQARDQVMAMYQAATTHDLNLARQAENTRKTLSAILTVAEVSMVVVGCVISLGLGGPVIIGGAMSAGAASWTSFGVSLGYGIAATAIKGKPGVWAAVGVKIGQSAGKKAISLAAGKAKKLADAHAANGTTGFEGTVATVKKLSASYGGAKAFDQLTTASPSQAALKASAARIAFTKNAIPVVFAVANVVSILKEGEKRWDE